MSKSIFANLQQHLVVNAPKALAFPSSLLPFWVQKKLLSEILAKVLDEAIEDGDLDFLQGKWLKIDVTDLKLTWYLSFAENKLVIKEHSEQVDVIFSAATNELILIAGRKEDPDTLFFQRRLSVQGDTELGLEVKNLLDNIDFDNLPTWVNKAMLHLSSFVSEGLQESDTKMPVI
ncbi:MAG: SCP2 sterol-binding domain-containing protein [Psychromonas sp.]|nr:SCP2 sterol-binding domain-containing protein [Psychromonas sp.]